jgi:hypothetical protein
VSDKSRLQFKIAGMDCAEEVPILKRAVGPAGGGEDTQAALFQRLVGLRRGV